MASRNSNTSKQGYWSLFLTYFDFYGARPEFTYKGNKTLTTTFGGFVSFLVFSTSAICSLFIAYRYFQKSSSETSIDRVYVKDPVGMSVAKESLPFAFGIQTGSGFHFIDESVYYPELKYVRISKSMVGGELVVNREETNLELIRCSEAKLNREMFDNLPLSDMYCLKQFIDSTLNLQITGEWESDLFGIIEFYIKRCVGPHCKSDSQIKEKLQVSYFAMNYINLATQVSNFENPVHKYPTSFYTTISTDYSKELAMRLADNEIITHSSLFGYFAPDSTKYTGTEIFTSDLVSVAIDKYPETLMFMRMRMSRIKTVTTRVYETAFEAFAEVGGIISLITVSAYIVSSRVTKTYLLVDMFKSANQRDPTDLNDIFVDPKSHPQSQQKPEDFIRAKSLIESPSSDWNKSHHPLSKNKVVQDKSSLNRQKRSGSFHPFASKKQLSLKRSMQPAQRLDLSQSNYVAPLNPSADAQKPATSSKDAGIDFARAPSPNQETNNKATSILKNNPTHRPDDSISHLSILAYSFLPCVVSADSPIHRVVKSSEKEVGGDIDFIAYIRLVNEVKKLKRLLLNAEQAVLFDKVSLPDISARNADRLKSASLVVFPLRGEQERQTVEDRILEAAIASISEKPSLSDIDKTLLRAHGIHLNDSATNGAVDCNL